MDLGFSQEGFDIRAAVEFDPAACATLMANWPKLKDRLIKRPLEDVTTRELLTTAGLKVGQVGLVFGGPPCQSWCVAGNRQGFNDPRGLALLEFCRVVREVQPAAFCVENVPGLLIHSKQDIVEIIAAEVNEGHDQLYQLSADVLDAAEYGVPQRRRRVFIVGWRGPVEFYFPAPTHQTQSSYSRNWKKPAQTVGETLAGMPAPTPPSEQAKRVAATIPKRNKEWYGKP